MLEEKDGELEARRLLLESAEQRAEEKASLLSVCASRVHCVTTVLTWQANLLANAAVHGAEQGRISVIGRRTPDAIMLIVRDEGTGLPQNPPDSIFQTFVRGTGSDRKGGSGLGLAIAKGFADAMQVGIEARNAQGGGAEFGLRFDVAAPGEPAEVPGERSSGA